MKISRMWLQKYFAEELPPAEAIADALTFHVAEIEGIEGDTLDVKVLPDRASYGLCHRGIANEVGAILNIPRVVDPLREPLPAYPTSDSLLVTIEDPVACPRYMGAVVRGVKVGPSPEWLKDALTSVGQRSINNVVDATNYVMLNIGQPLHAFDAGKLGKGADGKYVIGVRGAKSGESITTLTGETYTLPEGTTLITDATDQSAIGIAGVKGGMGAKVDEHTTDLVIESANFDGTRTRKTSQQLKLWTDASLRYQNKLSPELTSYGMRDVLALITDVAGGTVEGIVDIYPHKEDSQPLVSVTTDLITQILGRPVTAEEVSGVFTRLGLAHTATGNMFTVSPSFERRDIVCAEDLIEEVGRVLGYDTIPSSELPAMETPPDQRRYLGIERIRDFMVGRGYAELSTQTFAKEGAITLSNPLDLTRPALRASLATNMKEALTRAQTVAPRVLGPDAMLKLFELGTVFEAGHEHLSLCVGYRQLIGKHSPNVLAEVMDELSRQFGMHISIIDPEIIEIDLSGVDLETLGDGYQPEKIVLGPYAAFSSYPFALRDIAVWTPEGTTESEVSTCILANAGDTLVRSDLFDRFIKEGRTSYAFRLVFQANDRTLSDADLDPVIQKVTDALNEKEGWEVR